MADVKTEEPLDSTPIEVPPSMREWVDSRVRAEFDRDRAFMKDILGAASKIVWAAVSAVAVVIAVLGFRTYKEIDSAIEDAAKTQVAAALRIADPNSPFSLT